MPNFITCIRFVCALFLIFSPTFSIPFYVLYVLGSISDILDGMIARKLGKESEFGAKLDTIADFVFISTVIIKTVRDVVLSTWLIAWIIGIAAVKCIGIVIGFVIYKKYFSEHTLLNKICGVLLFFIPLYIGIFPRKPIEIPITLICAIATVAAIQEVHYFLKGKEVK